MDHKKGGCTECRRTLDCTPAPACPRDCRQATRLNWKAPKFVGRDDMETLLASRYCGDWVPCARGWRLHMIIFLLRLQLQIKSFVQFLAPADQDLGDAAGASAGGLRVHTQAQGECAQGRVNTRSQLDPRFPAGADEFHWCVRACVRFFLLVSWVCWIKDINPNVCRHPPDSR